MYLFGLLYKYSKILLNSYPKTISFLKNDFQPYLLYNQKTLLETITRILDISIVRELILVGRDWIILILSTLELRIYIVNSMVLLLTEILIHGICCNAPTNQVKETLTFHGCLQTGLKAQSFFSIILRKRTPLKISSNASNFISLNDFYTKMNDFLHLPV